MTWVSVPAIQQIFKDDFKSYSLVNGLLVEQDPELFDTWEAVPRCVDVKDFEEFEDDTPMLYGEGNPIPSGRLVINPC